MQTICDKLKEHLQRDVDLSFLKQKDVDRISWYIDTYFKEEEVKQLLNFCHFIGKEGYKINGYDDGMLDVVIRKFLNIQSAPVAQ